MFRNLDLGESFACNSKFYLLAFSHKLKSLDTMAQRFFLGSELHCLSTN